MRVAKRSEKEGPLQRSISVVGGGETQTEAGEVIRSLLTSITLIPEGDSLAIELVGELAGLLALGNPRNAESHPKVACSVSMVASAGIHSAWVLRRICFVRDIMRRRSCGQGVEVGQNSGSVSGDGAPQCLGVKLA
ncbi:hypothetical protein AB9F26_11470 [Falsihalocynthiibacter sp. BN13B15]|uniref:hypothetical protein n=1 Tax=Falsihalocynthiibacter sp. BN13B15 TaxID=3240871 RepID=UPI00350F5657